MNVFSLMLDYVVPPTAFPPRAPYFFRWDSPHRTRNHSFTPPSMSETRQSQDCDGDSEGIMLSQHSCRPMVFPSEHEAYKERLKWCLVLLQLNKQFHNLIIPVFLYSLWISHPYSGLLLLDMLSKYPQRAKFVRYLRIDFAISPHQCLVQLRETKWKSWPKLNFCSKSFTWGADVPLEVHGEVCAYFSGQILLN
jgi:hypothetical protein